MRRPFALVTRVEKVKPKASCLETFFKHHFLMTQGGIVKGKIAIRQTRDEEA